MYNNIPKGYKMKQSFFFGYTVLSFVKGPMGNKQNIIILFLS